MYHLEYCVDIWQSEKQVPFYMQLFQNYFPVNRHFVEKIFFFLQLLWAKMYYGGWCHEVAGKYEQLEGKIWPLCTPFSVKEVPVSLSEGGMASVLVILIDQSVALVPVSLGKVWGVSVWV